VNWQRLLALVIFGTALSLFWTAQSDGADLPDTGSEVESATPDDRGPVVVHVLPELMKPTAARPMTLETERPTVARAFVGEIFRPPILSVA
jgi:hypothetical protein